MPLTKEEVKLLSKINTTDKEQGFVQFIESEQIREVFNSLVDRGYIKFVKLRAAPFMQYTGDEAIKMTEAGSDIIKILELPEEEIKHANILTIS